MKRTHLYLALGAAAVLGFGCRHAVRPHVDEDRPRHGIRIVYSLDSTRAVEQETEALGRPLTPTEADAIRATALRQAVSAIRDRIAAVGVAEPLVMPKDDQIVVELPGLDDETSADVRSLVARTAKLEFAMVIENHPVMQAIYHHARSAEAVAQGIEPQTDAWTSSTGEFLDYYLVAHDRDDDPPASGRQVLERYPTGAPTIWSARRGSTTARWPAPRWCRVRTPRGPRS